MHPLSQIYWRKYLPVYSNLVQIVYTGSEFYFAHAQRKFVKVVLYQKIIGLATLTIVESFMLVSGIAQSWLLAAQLVGTQLLMSVVGLIQVQLWRQMAVEPSTLFQYSFIIVCTVDSRYLDVAYYE